jgi:protein required for attachment to host cells
MGGARHVIEPHEPKKDRSARLFAHRIAEELRTAHERRRYARLFVVAPPRFLGVICAEIGDMDAAGVAGTLGKDVVGLSAEVAERHIRAAFPRDFTAEAREGHLPADDGEAQRGVS